MAIENFPQEAATGYDECRPDIKPGDLLLCSGTKPFSRMIRTATDSEWSHVGFVMPLSVIDRVMVLARKILGVFRFRYRYKSPRVVQVQC